MGLTITSMGGSNFFSGKTGNSENLFESWNVVGADVHKRNVNTTRTMAAIHLPLARKKIGGF